MSRLLAVVSVVLCVPFVLGADPTPVEKQLAIQKAMLTARQFLDVNMSAEAVAALEAEIANADGNKAFLTLLREAYLAELVRLEKAATPDAPRVAQVRRNLALLGGAGPATPASPPPAAPPAAVPVRTEAPAIPPPSFDTPGTASDSATEAVAAFKKGNYPDAARLFASTASLTADQKAAWAYCRVKLAADRVNASTCDPAAAAALADDVAEALKLAPQHAELQKVGQQVIAMAAAKSKGLANPARPTATDPDVVETASFRVRHSGNRELAETIAKAAETQRKVIFERWSGPPAGPWSVKCDIVIHATAEAYAKITSRPAGSTGNAMVRLTDGRAESRRIDLRADDATIESNALPRELTQVVLADLFPDKPAPKWAVEGMAILASTHEEAGRYTRTLSRCARDGEWFALGQLMDLKDFPADKITAFYCESVSLTEYLIRTGGGERNFTIFLRDCQRYGTAQALKRQYGIDGPQALESAWKQSAVEPGR